MIANAIGNRVRVALATGEPVVLERLSGELLEAQERYDAHLPHYSTSELRPFQERLSAAETEFDDLFSETLTVDRAEEVHRRLGAAILAARINAGTARIF